MELVGVGRRDFFVIVIRIFIARVTAFGKVSDRVGCLYSSAILADFIFSSVHNFLFIRAVIIAFACSLF